MQQNTTYISDRDLALKKTTQKQEVWEFIWWEKLYQDKRLSLNGYQNYPIHGMLRNNGEIEENYPQQAFHMYGGKGMLDPRESVV